MPAGFALVASDELFPVSPTSKKRGRRELVPVVTDTQMFRYRVIELTDKFAYQVCSACPGEI